MRLDYLNPIVDSAVRALADVAGAPIERGTLRLLERSEASKDVAAVIGMAGEVEGRVILEMNRATAIAAASAMNSESFSELTPFVLDTVMEMANVMIARGVSVLNDKGFTFRLAPPLVFTGTGMSSSSSLDLETLMVPLMTPSGEMTLNIALRMKSL
jgi:chemotaxis protein CheX